MAGLIFDQFSGVAVGDASGEFLHRKIRERFVEVVGCRNLRTPHLMHARSLECHRVECACHREIVANHDGVSTFFGGPVACPGAISAVTAEDSVNVARVVRQVVFGEKVDEE